MPSPIWSFQNNMAKIKMEQKLQTKKICVKKTQIKIAEKSGFCFGVKRAIELAEKTADIDQKFTRLVLSFTILRKLRGLIKKV